MYNPAHFTETRLSEILRIVIQHPLACLVTQTGGELSANHLPLLAHHNNDGITHFTGHIARNNPLATTLENGEAVLVIYRAGDAYITPNSYPSKHETHQAVPTWNYQAVHFSGTIELIDDKKFLLGVVGRLTKIHESQSGQAKPWTINQAPADYLDMMLANIVGLKITVTKTVAKSKLSQNRSAADRAGVIETLSEKGGAAVEIINAMQRN